MYLVIGATEMVGAHLVCALLRQGMRVRAMLCKGDDPEYTKHILSFYTNDFEGQFNEIEWVDADYNDITSLSDAMKDVCTVFCCKVPKVTWRHSINDNVFEIKNIVAAAQESDIKSFIYLSSYHTLGEEPDTKEINELSQRNPKGKYSDFALAHYHCEMEVRRAMEEGLAASILAPSVVIGPGNWTTDISHQFPDAKQREYTTLGVTGFVGVNDVVKCLLMLARKRIHGEKFIANSQNMSYKNLHRLIAQQLGTPVPQKLATKRVIALYKVCYVTKSIFTGRRPLLNKLYTDSLNDFRLIDNTKSINRLIAAYEPIDSVIKTVSRIYKADHASTRE